MPALDKTGPEGAGPMTGRKMGRCNGYGAKQRNTIPPENQDEDYDKTKEQGSELGLGGRGFGWGGGMEFRHRFRGGCR